MLTRWRGLVLTMLTLFVVGSGPVLTESLPKEGTWAWIHVGPALGKWESDGGKATVSIRPS